MSVPGYQEFMLPLLKIAADGHEHTISGAMVTLANELSVSEVDREELLPSGLQTRFYNRVIWAITYLIKSQLLERPMRGRFRISPRGIELVKQGELKVMRTNNAVPI